MTSERKLYPDDYRRAQSAVREALMEGMSGDVLEDIATRQLDPRIGEIMLKELKKIEAQIAGEE